MADNTSGYRRVAHTADLRIEAWAPQLPQRWGKLVLTDLRLGPAIVQIDAEG